MASQDFIVPDSPTEWIELRRNLVIVLGSVLGVLVLFFGQILLLDSVPGLNRFRLAAPESGELSELELATSGTLLQSAAISQPATVGMQGVAESDLRPSGKAMMEGRLFDVITEGDYVEAGRAIEVLRIEGNRITVRSL